MLNSGAESEGNKAEGELLAAWAWPESTIRSMDCAHNNQRPDGTKKVWICMDCGADTKPFETEASGKSERISEGSGDGKPDQ